jgi:spermidine/putrescine-binding protein
MFKLLALMVVFSLALAACGRAATPPPTQTPKVTLTPPPATAEAPKVTSTGYTCPEPNPRMEVTSKVLNLLVWTEYIPADIVECFELIYGVTVNRDEFSSAEEMLVKLSKGNTGYDLAHVSDNVVVPSIRLGLLQKLDKSKLSIMNYFDPQYMNLAYDPGNQYTLPYEFGSDAIVYNSGKVPNPPTSWADLWKPEYAGRMVFIDDSRAIIGLTLLTLGYDVNTTDPKQLDEAKVKLTELVKNIKLFDSDSPKTSLLAGDADLGVIFSGEASLAQKENANIKYIYPTEGAILWQDNWAIPANAPHLDAAYAWLNYSMQPDLFWMMLRDFPYTNPNIAALNWAKTNQPELYKAYMDSSITNVPPDAAKKGHFIVDVGDALPLFDQIWTEVKGPQ